MFREHRFTCSRCHKPRRYRSTISTGYGIFGKSRKKVCFACCAEIDRVFMERHGRIALYLSKDEAGRWCVTNWPGTLRLATDHVREGRHNIAGIRRDVWFRDHTGRRWHGVNVGHWCQIVHARRLKA